MSSVEEYPNTKLYINGKWRSAFAKETLDVIRRALEDDKSTDLKEDLLILNRKVDFTILKVKFIFF